MTAELATGIKATYDVQQEGTLGLTWQQEHELISRVRAGDNTSFEPIFSMYLPKMIRLASYTGCSVVDAEDVASTAMINGYNAVLNGTYEPRKGIAFGAYLLRSTRNRAVSFLREKHKHTIGETIERFRVEEDKPIGDQAVDNILNNERRLMLNDILSRLTDVQRQIILMHLVYDIDYIQIAELLGKTVDNIRMLQFRGIEKVRQIMYEEDSFEIKNKTIKKKINHRELRRNILYILQKNADDTIASSKLARKLRVSGETIRKAIQIMNESGDVKIKTTQKGYTLVN